MSDGQAKGEYYVRGADEKVFGPVPMETLVEWAADSRIDPTSAVSADQVSWKPAPLVPELEMIWLVETDPGVFYGPFNRHVVDGLLESGTITREARLYVLDNGRLSRLTAEIEAKTKAISDLEARAAEQAVTTKKTMDFMEAKLAELAAEMEEMGKAAETDHAAAKDDVFKTRERAEAAESRAMQAEAACGALEKKLSVAETEIADLKAQLASVTKFSSVRPRTVKTDVVQPEVVISDMPPPKSTPHFPGVGSASGLAALEAAAKRELAAAKKQGISLGGLFGGKK